MLTIDLLTLTGPGDARSMPTRKARKSIEIIGVYG